MYPLRKLRATPAVVVNRVRAIRKHAFLPHAQNDSGDSCRSSLKPFVRRRQRNDLAAAAAPLCRLATTTRIRPATAAGPQEAA